MPVLADEVIQLRRWTRRDVAAMLAAFRDPWFERFNDWAPGTSAEAPVYLTTAEQDRQQGIRIELAIVATLQLDAVLGGASLHAVDADRGRAAVGYWLVPDARGRGVATRAVRLLARWAFNDLRLARLQLTCGPDKEASQRVAEHCGFRREGVLRSHQPFKGGRRDTGLIPSDLG